MTRPAPEDTLDWMHVSEALEGRINIKILPNGRKAIVIKQSGSDDASSIRIFDEVCPHLGADMSEAKLCQKTGTLQCRWHGYIFSTEDGCLRENPNEQFMKLLREPSKHFSPGRTPRYRLSQLPFVVHDDRIYFLKSRATAAAQQAARTQQTAASQQVVEVGGAADESGPRGASAQ